MSIFFNCALWTCNLLRMTSRFSNVPPLKNNMSSMKHKIWGAPYKMVSITIWNILWSRQNSKWKACELVYSPMSVDGAVLSGFGVKFQLEIGLWQIKFCEFSHSRQGHKKIFTLGRGYWLAFNAGFTASPVWLIYCHNWNYLFTVGHFLQDSLVLKATYR